MTTGESIAFQDPALTRVSGQALRAMSRRMPFGRLAGIDYSAKMVEQVRRRRYVR